MNFRTLPTVTKNILIISILAFLATTFVQRVDLIKILGLHYFTASDFKPYQFVTYIFMHGGWSHLFFNMFALFMFGSVLENAWGPKRFLIFYLFTGLGAALVQILVWYLLEIAPKLEIWQAVYDQTSDYMRQTEMLEDKKEWLNHFVVVGASGSLFGLLIAFGMMFPNAELMMLFLPIPIKAKYFVAIYGAIELFSGLANSASDNVAHFAHLGGMLFGFILMMIWRRKPGY